MCVWIDLLCGWIDCTGSRWVGEGRNYFVVLFDFVFAPRSCYLLGASLSELSLGTRALPGISRSFFLSFFLISSFSFFFLGFFLWIRQRNELVWGLVLSHSWWGL